MAGLASPPAHPPDGSSAPDGSPPHGAPSEGSSAPVGSWAFWRARLPRYVLLGGALALVLQWAPSFEREHPIVFEVAPSAQLVTLELALTQDGERVAVAQLSPQSPQQRVRYTARVAAGTYELYAVARVLEPCESPAPCEARVLELRRPLTLGDAAAVIRLAPER